MNGFRAAALALIFLLPIAGACKSIPRCPSDKAWERTPIIQTGQKTIEVQGEFKNSTVKFLEAAANLKDGLTKEEVMKLGFSPELKNQPSCDSVGWLETSGMILGNVQLKETDMESVVKNKKLYSAIRCRAKDVRTRTDRMFTYINNRDTCGRGIDITLTIIFKNQDDRDIVVGVDLNKRPVKSLERHSAFFQLLGDIINPPKLNIDPNAMIKIPY